MSGIWFWVFLYFVAMAVGLLWVWCASERREG